MLQRRRFQSRFCNEILISCLKLVVDVLRMEFACLPIKLSNEVSSLLEKCVVVGLFFVVVVVVVCFVVCFGFVCFLFVCLFGWLGFFWGGWFNIVKTIWQCCDLET